MRFASKRRPGRATVRPMRPSWRSAAPAGRNSARMASGSRRWRRRSGRSAPPAPGQLRRSWWTGRTHFRDRFQGTPLHNVGASVRQTESVARRGAGHPRRARRRGRLRAVRRAARRRSRGTARRSLTIDLRPDIAGRRAGARVCRRAPPASRSRRALRKTLKLAPVAVGLLHEAALATGASAGRARCVRARRARSGPCRSACRAPRAARRARSPRRVASGSTPSTPASCCARGPGTFVAGEMLDWEAPTGGYLLQACFATGARRGTGRSIGCAARTLHESLRELDRFGAAFLGAEDWHARLHACGRDRRTYGFSAGDDRGATPARARLSRRARAGGPVRGTPIVLQGPDGLLSLRTKTRMRSARRVQARMSSRTRTTSGSPIRRRPTATWPDRRVRNPAGLRR